MLQIVITTLNVLSRSLVKMVEFPNFEYFFPTLEAQERRGELAGSVHSNPDTRLNTEDLNKSTRLNREFKSRDSSKHREFKSMY